MNSFANVNTEIQTQVLQFTAAILCSIHNCYQLCLPTLAFYMMLAGSYEVRQHQQTQLRGMTKNRHSLDMNSRRKPWR
jgi:hypothetical protein